MGHGDLLQSEKETLSFKESHGYCQKGEKKKKKKIVMIEQVFLRLREAGGAG